MHDNSLGGPIVWKVHLRIAPETVFQALNTDQGRQSFWAKSAVEKNSIIQFQFINGTTYQSQILERDPPRKFQIDYFGGPATFDLTSDGAGGTDLTLTHTGVAEPEWLETHAGWLNVLLVMKAAVVHGVDLRNHDPQRSWDQGYVDQ